MEEELPARPAEGLEDVLTKIKWLRLARDRSERGVDASDLAALEAEVSRLLATPERAVA